VGRPLTASECKSEQHLATHGVQVGPRAAWQGQGNVAVIGETAQLEVEQQTNTTSAQTSAPGGVAGRHQQVLGHIDCVGAGEQRRHVIWGQQGGAIKHCNAAREGRGFSEQQESVRALE